ncbi:hypothetical protein PVAP13_5KG124300 [Panicum virgatum]|uniref:Uncharacterized protein n=1 Tax=Panicum virgatum TaxID=38727 RepID=A0A8T0SHC0_PANVG|nr:hypothetical protein PVAP13_5KG124300 [Panicum virgatum]
MLLRTVCLPLPREGRYCNTRALHLQSTLLENAYIDHRHDLYSIFDTATYHT